MPTIEKRGDTYRITVSCGYDINGKQIKQKKTWTPSPGMTKKQIEKELKRQTVLFEEKCKGIVTGGSSKFEAIAGEWLTHIEKNELVRPRTLERLKQLKERTYAAIGHLRIDKITVIHVQRFIDNLSEQGINKRTGGGLSVKTRKHYLSFISDVFEYSIKCGMTEKNPCRHVDIKGNPKAEKDCYTPEEAQQFLNCLKAAPLKYRIFFTLAIYGGFRRGELLGFEWKDVDFDSGVISVTRTSLYTKEKGMFTDTTKTPTSQRSIKLPDEVITLLRTYRAEQAQERLKIGDAWIDTDRLFTTWNGEPMGHTSAINWLMKFCERNGLRYVNVHSFRHLNASLLINCGVDAKTVSASLGHSQVSTTLNIYTHAFAATQARASEAIANALPLNIDKKKKA